MRRLGWIDIDMVEISNRKLHTSRERVGLNLNFDRGVNNSARDVEEALARLADIESRFREHAAKPRDGDGDEDMDLADEDTATATYVGASANHEDASSGTAPWMEGRLITRGEPEIKTHTSYLVFAVLPMEWTEEDEAAAAAKYPVGKEQRVIGAIDKAARKQERREQLQKQQQGSNRKTRRKERDEKMGQASA